MKREKWKPKVINIMADGTIVEDLSNYVIPAGHIYYDIMYGIAKNEVTK